MAQNLRIFYLIINDFHIDTMLDLQKKNIRGNPRIDCHDIATISDSLPGKSILNKSMLVLNEKFPDEKRIERNVIFP